MPESAATNSLNVTNHEKILIIDDETSFRQFIVRVLEDFGYTCFQAGNIDEARETLKKNDIDLCLLDILMPGKSGDKYLKELKRTYPEIAVIMSTGISTFEMAETCIYLGVDDYLVKPFEPERLLISLRNVFERRRLLQENKFHLQHLEHQLQEQAEILRKSQSLLIQQEKLASIGQLAAGVAHEINNPLGFVSGNLRALKKYSARIAEFKEIFDEVVATLNSENQQELLSRQRKIKLNTILADMPDLIDDSLEGMKQIDDIVNSLKTFSRTESDEAVCLDVNECLESAIKIVWNEIKYNSKLEKDLSDLPDIKGYPQQLAQVFMNLLVNASHAIVSDGLISVKTSATENAISITITDNGCGIAKENLKKIFDPFFTTKPSGKGTGLGMSIASDIVMKHGGKIGVVSEVGKGSAFTIILPQPATVEQGGMACG